MTVYPLITDFVKLYSKGIEKKYNGTNIEYYDDKITFLFFYYSCHTVVYVINGKKSDFQLVQVKEKVNRIAVFYSRDAKRFIRFFNIVIQEDDLIFKLPPLFFRECLPLLSQKKYINHLSKLYIKYKNEIKEGKYFPDV